MTEPHARATANVLMAAAATAAAVFVLRSPRRRRIAWQVVRQYATGPLSAWTAATVYRAWVESGSTPARTAR